MDPNENQEGVFIPTGEMDTRWLGEVIDSIDKHLKDLVDEQKKESRSGSAIPQYTKSIHDAILSAFSKVTAAAASPGKGPIPAATGGGVQQTGTPSTPQSKGVMAVDLTIATMDLVSKKLAAALVVPLREVNRNLPAVVQQAKHVPAVVLGSREENNALDRLRQSLGIPADEKNWKWNPKAPPSPAGIPPAGFGPGYDELIPRPPAPPEPPKARWWQRLGGWAKSQWTGGERDEYGMRKPGFAKQAYGHAMNAATSTSDSKGHDFEAIGSSLKAVGSVASMFGPAGQVAGAAFKFGGMLTDSVGKLRGFAEGLHNANMQFAEFSGAMAQVEADQQVRDIEYSRERGEARAESARQLAEAKSRFDRTWAPMMDSIAKAKNKITSTVLDLVTPKNVGKAVEAGTVGSGAVYWLQKLFGIAQKYDNPVVPEANSTINAAEWMSDMGDAWVIENYGEHAGKGKRMRGL